MMSSIVGPTTSHTPAIPNTTQNSTSVGLSDAEQYLWASWCSLILLTSIPGNILILVSSLKYQAIKLDKISVICIQNIAIADLASAAVTIIPKLADIVNNGRIFIYGDEICAIRPFIAGVSGGTAILFIAALNVAKLTTLLDPFGARLRTKRSGYLIAATLWSAVLAMFALLQLVTFVETGEFWTGYYDEELFVCTYSVISSLTLDLYYIFFIAVIGIPMTIIIVTTVWLLRFVQNERGLHRQTVVTLVAISAVFVVSYTPSILRIVLKQLDSESYILYYSRSSISLLYLNIAANPVIYYVTMKSFRNFVNRTIRTITRQQDDVQPPADVPLQPVPRVP